MPVLTSAPLVGGAGKPVTGRVAVAATAEYQWTDGVGVVHHVTTTPQAGVVRDGQFFDLDGSTPLTLIPTPVNVGMRVVLHLDESGAQRGQHVMSRIVEVPNLTSVAWADLVDVVPPVVGGDYVVPPWASSVITYRDEAAASATAAATSASSAASSETSAVAARDRAEAVPTSNDTIIEGQINTATSKTRVALNGIYETPSGAQIKADAAKAAAVTESKDYAGTLAYGTNLEATDASVAAWVNDAASATGTAVNGKAWQKANMAAGQDFDAMVTPGSYAVSALPTDWVAQHWPTSTRGVLTVWSVVTTDSVVQVYTTWTSGASISYARSRTSSTWGAWSTVGTASEALVATSNFNTFTQPGRYALAAVPTDWAAQNMPANVRGVLTVLGMNTTSAFIQSYHTWETAPRLFIRQYASGAFQAWREVGAAAAASTATPDKPGSGMKRVGVPITAGHSGSDAPLEATVRMPLLYQAPIVRWRLRIQDINPRSGVTRAGAVNVSGIWVGTHTGAGAMSSPVQLSGPFTIADAAVEHKTPWFSTPLDAGTEYLLSFGYTKTTAPWAMLGYSYQTADDVNAGDANPAGMSKLGTAPFAITLEAETYTHTPVVASLGDSNSVGVGAANGLHDSWLSQLCRRIKALPVHLGSSGDTCINSRTAAYKYTRLADYARPDAVIMALGQNDIAVTNTTAATVQADVTTVLGLLATHVSDTVYAVNYMPRTTDPWAGFELVRRDVNAWLLTQPGTIRDVFNIGAAISNDDDTIRAEYDADGTHLNAAGFGAVQAAISRPVTTPPVLYATV